MINSDRIDFDVQCLKSYFQLLFSLSEGNSEIKPILLENGEHIEQFVNHKVAAFIRPDMACNIYNLVDFWLAELCAFHKQKNNLPRSYKDIKGKKGPFHDYHDYLTKVASLDLQAVLPSFDYLDALRKFRNCLVHGGAHVEEQKRQEIERIAGVSLYGSLIVLSDTFIWDSLNHARTYLCAVAQA
jgi:hypothetical protein